MNNIFNLTASGHSQHHLLLEAHRKNSSDEILLGNKKKVMNNFFILIFDLGEKFIVPSACLLDEGLTKKAQCIFFFLLKGTY